MDDGYGKKKEKVMLDYQSYADKKNIFTRF